MWYFTWILGINVAVALAIINVMWLESNYAFGQRDEDQTRDRFERASRGEPLIEPMAQDQPQ